MNKHAYLIMAHNKFEQLAFLVSLLDDARNDIFIHIDKRSKLSPDTVELIKKSARLSTVRLIPRQSVYWGDFSQIKCELALYQAASEHGPYAMYHLLSGVDLPLVHQDKIHQFFDDKLDNIFITRNDSRQFETNGYYNLIEHYHLSTKISRRRLKSSIAKKVLDYYRRSESKLQQLLKVDRLKGQRQKLGVDSYSNWRTLNHPTVETLLQDTPFIKKYFQHTFCADEIYLSVILKRHHLLDTIYDYRMHLDTPEEFQGNLRYINWWDGSPYEWTDSAKDMAQLEQAEQMGHFFARKFDLEKYPKLKDYIMEKVTNSSQFNSQ